MPESPQSCKIFCTTARIAIFFILPIWSMNTKLYSSLYLDYSIYKYILTGAPRRFFETYYLPVFFSVIILACSTRADSLLFPYIYDQLYPNFKPLPDLQLFGILLALLLVIGIPCLCIPYSNCVEWSRRNSCPCWILLGSWLGRDISLKSRDAGEYCPDIIWTSYIRQTDSDEFMGIVFSCSPRLVASSRLKNQCVLLFTHCWRENNWIHTFPKSISAMWNAISLAQ